MEYNPISCQICALGFTFAAAGRPQETLGCFSWMLWNPVVQGAFTEKFQLFLVPPFGNLSLHSPSPSPGWASPPGSLQALWDFYWIKGENLSLSFSPRERLIRYLGQQCSCGILYFNSISAEQHPLLIFHFGLFFLRAFLLVWLCEFAPTCYQALAFILWALICIKPKSKG